ncbi:MAG: hypothetical protein C5S49_04560 [Candidatus Methanogaster sp.]|nr:MAG: hypothetical protein C5S49_04560 [ANME-2 cluster archaeon]
MPGGTTPEDIVMGMSPPPVKLLSMYGLPMGYINVLHILLRLFIIFWNCVWKVAKGTRGCWVMGWCDVGSGCGEGGWRMSAKKPKDDADSQNHTPSAPTSIHPKTNIIHCSNLQKK